MRKLLTILALSILNIYCALSQRLPQEMINQALSNRAGTVATNPSTQVQPSGVASGVYQLLKRHDSLMEVTHEEMPGCERSTMTDTVYVGIVPGDTLTITGTYFNNGPVLVFNDGVLIVHNANATILGNIYVFQNGKMNADSSTLNLPQQYFYQRSVIVANSGRLDVTNCTFDFSGLSHNLVASDSAQIHFADVTNVGFTTAGAYSHSVIDINGTNQAGEFIMQDFSQLTFNNAATILLWHHIPQQGVIDFDFPTNGTVPAYSFNNTIPGVSGLDYSVQLTNCTDVMFSLMPENGSDVTISNSVIRAIGAWFMRGDTVNVSGLVNNSTYSSFTAPLADRNLQLNNCSVQTWSIYIFDSSQIDITGCIVGEVGSMGNSVVIGQNVFCDGSGGYYWANGESFNVLINSSVSSYVRSEGNGIFLFGYGTVNGGASSLGNSVIIVTQSNLPQEPVPYDASTAWYQKIDLPSGLYTESNINIPGSAWIDQGPLGSFMNFDSYRLWYSLPGSSTWNAIGGAITNEVHNGSLGTWDTHGLPAGSYNLRLVVFNNSSDSIEAVRQVTLLPSVVGINENEATTLQSYAYPVPAGECITLVSPLLVNQSKVLIYDSNGRLVKSINTKPFINSTFLDIQTNDWNTGIYFAEIESAGCKDKIRFVVSR